MIMLLNLQSRKTTLAEIIQLSVAIQTLGSMLLKKLGEQNIPSPRL